MPKTTKIKFIKVFVGGQWTEEMSEDEFTLKYSDKEMQKIHIREETFILNN